MYKPREYTCKQINNLLISADIQHVQCLYKLNRMSQLHWMDFLDNKCVSNDDNEYVLMNNSLAESCW